MIKKSAWSKWLGIVYLRVKLGDLDPDVAIISAWVDRDLTKHPPTPQELEATRRIKQKLASHAAKSNEE